MSVSLRNVLAAAVRALRARGQQRRRSSRGVPGLRAFALEQVDDLAIQRGVDDRLVAAFAKEDGDGHAPDALAADAPVGARGDHVGDALLAPGRIPDDLVDLFDGELTESCFRSVGALHRRFERDEPLLGGAEDDGVVAAPAVRVGVLEVAPPSSAPRSSSMATMIGIRGPDLLAVERRRRGQVPRCRDRRG